jgi:cytochrome oxidase Cu insertion factor (SCO1/SenC/PrrC family)
MQTNRKILVIGMWSMTALAALAVGTMTWLVRSKDAKAADTAVVQVITETPTSELPILFDSPSFNLTDQNGKPFDSQQLHGKVWVADFIFTHCAGLCPLMTQNLARFQKQSEGSPVQMVSFSVDPENDTPPVLKKYAAEVKADETRWHFLTGTRAQTWEISKGMKLAVGPDTGDQVMHSSHFLLVDANGKVRGIYDSDTVGFMKKLLADSANLSH